MEVRFEDADHARQSERHRIGQLPPQDGRVRSQPRAELAPQVEESGDAADETEDEGADQERLEPPEQEHRDHEASGPDKVGPGVGHRGPQKAMTRSQHDFQHGGGQHEKQEASYEGKESRDPGVAEPQGDARVQAPEQPEGQNTRARKRQHRIQDAASRLQRTEGNEVEETLGHPELRDAVQAEVDEEELLVGAELGLIEDPHEHERDDERHGRAQGPPGHQQEDRPGGRLHHAALHLAP